MSTIKNTFSEHLNDVHKRTNISVEHNNVHFNTNYVHLNITIFS